jgi:glycosyltransferase involved in cell wall biosynthesis
MKKKRKLIMIALFPPPFSSGERMLNLINREILKKDMDVVSFNVSSGKLLPGNFSWDRIKSQLKTMYLYIVACQKTMRLLRKEPIDSLYLVTPGSKLGHIRDSIILSLIGPNIPLKVAFIQNGHIDKVFTRAWHSYFTRNFINRCQYFVFTSKGLMNKVKDIPLEKKVCLPNSIDEVLSFTEEECLIKRNRPFPHTIRLLYLSNLTPSKGYMDFSNAIVSLHKMGVSITADVVGEWLTKEQEEQYLEFLESNQIKHLVSVHGKIHDRSIIRSFFQEATFFILPTYFSHEAQPVSIIEALNAGVPVISTYHASIPEMIDSGIEGVLVPIKTPAAIVEAVKEYGVSSKWQEMSKRARLRFEKQFGREAYTKSLLQIFCN